ncbi:MAG: metallopeptidase TldD-related protein [Alphaproteobacteria bacterium]|nr:metallopeptidase TldD-related protein [Alphaproteobacteria bacterium]
MTDRISLLQNLLAKAKRLGAEAADAVVFGSVSSSVSYRLGKLEEVERSESSDLGLRVFIGKRQAAVASTDFSERTLDQLAERAVAMARTTPEDPYCGLAPRELLAKTWPSLDLEDSDEPSSERLVELAKNCEGAAREVKGITNSEGASAGWGRGAVALATSEGFAGSYASTSVSVSVSVLAGEGTHMERDYDFSSARYVADLADPQAVGRSAAERTLKRLNPRKVSTQSVPVIYDPRVSNSIVGHLAGAINGISIARGTSFLKDKMGQRIFAAGIRIVDDPHIVRGVRSKPFDGEGVANRAMNLIEDGELKTWLLDSASARQLGLTTTGHAARGTGGPPSPSVSNLYLVPGTATPEDLIGDIKQGFYVNELIGMGVNGVTGDYSRGAAGFWIENGKLAYPVSEVTIAGNLNSMFAHVIPANDLVFKYGTNAPTLRIDGMTVAGS